MKSIEFNEEKSLLLTLLDMFDSDWYMSNYPALAENNVDPLTDYILCGAEVGRNPNSLFDTGWYLEQYPEVKKSEINPLIHYIKEGASKGYNPNPLFHTEWYLAEHPEIAAKNINPLSHYLNQGVREGCNPNPLFDTKWYLEKYPDVAATGVNPLSHYISQGGFENRDPCPQFNTKYYLAKHPSIVESKTNPLVYYFTYLHGAELNPELYTLPSFIEEQLREASEIEPLLKLSLNKLNSFPIVYHPKKLASLDALEIIEKKVTFDIDHLILLPNLELIDSALARIPLEKILDKINNAGSVFVLATDGNDPQDLGFIPEDICSMSLSNVISDIDLEQREKVILFIIQNYRPKYVWNINSRAAWRLFVKSGKPLSTLTKLNAYLFLSQDQAFEVSTVKEINNYRKNILNITNTYVANTKSKVMLENICGLSDRLKESVYTLD